MRKPARKTKAEIAERAAALVHEQSAPGAVTVREWVHQVNQRHGAAWSSDVEASPRSWAYLYMFFVEWAGIPCQNSPVAPEIHCAENLHSLQLFQFTEDFFPARRELEMKADLRHV